jgi:hypothetical protein
MNANSTLLEVFEMNIHKSTENVASVKKEEQIQIKPVQKSFIQDISHQTPNLDFEIDYFHLVLLTRDRVVLVGDDLKTFPILAKQMPSKKEIASFISTYSIKNSRTIIEPTLRSAFLVGETKREGFLKSDIIQYHNVDGIKVHPSVWSFFHLYPEYIGNDILYRVQSIMSDNYIIQYLQDRYDVFILRNDAERLGLQGQSKERRLGKLGFIDVNTTEQLDEKIEKFTKEFKVEHICIRIVQEHIIPVWIVNPR